MTYKLTLSKLFIIYFLFSTSCNNQDKVNSKNSSVDNDNLNKIVYEWVKAHNSKDIGLLSNLYHTTILYYGTKKDKNSCIESKLSFFKKYPDYYQQIFGEIQSEKLTETEVKFTFLKRVTFNQQTKDYPSYLIVSKKENNWKLITEGDFMTDKNLEKIKEIKAPKDAVKGDFDGNGTLEYAWLIPPKIDSEGMGCIGDCISYIKFSDATILSIKVEPCISGYPTNLGDINKNGTDEIGLLPGWFTSCWRSYYVFTLRNEKWINAVEPFLTHCNQWDEGIKPIEIDRNKEGNVIIRYSEHADADIVTKTKSVIIK